MSNRVFGCDDCLAVCPWNKFASASADLKLAAQDGRALPSLAGMLSLDEAGFEQYFSASPETYRLYSVSAQLSDRGRKCR